MFKKIPSHNKNFKLNGTNGVNGVLVQAVKPSERVHAMRQQLYLPLVANVLEKIHKAVHVLKSFPKVTLFLNFISDGIIHVCSEIM